MVGELSTVTAVLAVSVSVPKSAVLSAPLPMTPSSQLAPLFQVPPASCVQVAVFRMEALKVKPVGWVNE